MDKGSPFIKADTSLPELTLRCIIVSIILTVVLAMANAYLALKIGILTSASIPAAIVSMSILRFFKQSNILENNLVQTAASAGEAVAGGIVYTIPALIIIQYWHHFDYFENVMIALIGGTLGVLFSIPLRKALVNDKALHFPEGRAVAEVLKSSTHGSIKEIVLGGVIGAFLELMQTGLKLIATQWQVWFTFKHLLFGMGLGFSSTMIGAGYLIGFNMALSIFIGAVIASCVALPLTSYLYPQYLAHQTAMDAMVHLVNAKVRYIGIGGMLFAGIWTFFTLLKPLARNIRRSLRLSFTKNIEKLKPLRTEKDIPFAYVLLSASFISALLFLFFQFIFPLDKIGFSDDYWPTLIFLAVVYVFVIGFLFSVITGYFSGMVGVTASPGSSVIIAGMLLAAWLLFSSMKWLIGPVFSSHQLQAAEAVTIIIGSVITGIAAIANDNVQDLKVGHLLGATPWKQQLMLILGVVVSALVIPPVMQLLFDVYGIAGVMPHPNMDPSQSLPAPPAALMAAITQAVFHRNLPWSMLWLGGGIIAILLLLNLFLSKQIRLSILGVAVGIYLPISSSIPLFLGGFMAVLIERRLHRLPFGKATRSAKLHKGVLLACGLVAGAALMDVVLAIPFSMMHSPDALNLAGPNFQVYATIFAVLSVLALYLGFLRIVCNDE